MNKSVRALILFVCFICLLIITFSCKGNETKASETLAISETKEALELPKTEETGRLLWFLLQRTFYQKYR